MQKKWATKYKWIMIDKTKINMIGGGFQHSVCSIAGSVPQHMEWVKDGSAVVSIYIDHAIKGNINKNTINYAWLAESKTINTGIYKWCIDNIKYLENNFKYIFTHDLSLLSLSNAFKMVIAGATPWIKDIKIHKKTKLVSMITSNKVICKDHIYRNEIANKFRNKCDLFGIGYNEIDKKELGLNDYCFCPVFSRTIGN